MVRQRRLENDGVKKGYSLKLINVLHLYGWDFINIDVSQIGLF